MIHEAPTMHDEGGSEPEPGREPLGTPLRRSGPPSVERDGRADPALVGRALLGSVVDGTDDACPERGRHLDRLDGVGGRGGIQRQRLPDRTAEPAPALEVSPAPWARRDVFA